MAAVWAESGKAGSAPRGGGGALPLRQVPRIFQTPSAWTTVRPATSSTPRTNDHRPRGAQHLGPHLHELAEADRRNELRVELNRGDGPAADRLPDGDAQRVVGEAHQHAAMDHAAQVQVPLLRHEAVAPAALAVAPREERADQRRVVAGRHGLPAGGGRVVSGGGGVVGGHGHGSCAVSRRPIAGARGRAQSGRAALRGEQELAVALRPEQRARLDAEHAPARQAVPPCGDRGRTPRGAPPDRAPRRPWRPPARPRIAA